MKLERMNNSIFYKVKLITTLITPKDHYYKSFIIFSRQIYSKPVDSCKNFSVDNCYGASSTKPPQNRDLGTMFHKKVVLSNFWNLKPMKKQFSDFCDF